MVRFSGCHLFIRFVNATVFAANQGETTPSHGYKNHWNCKWIDMESKKWANFLGTTNAPSNLLAVSHAGDAYKLEPPLRGCQVAIVWHLKCQKWHPHPSSHHRFLAFVQCTWSTRNIWLKLLAKTINFPFPARGALEKRRTRTWNYSW